MKKYTQEEVDKIIDLHQIMMQESKESVLQQKFKIRFKATAVLLKWMKGVEKRNVSEEEKQALRSDVNAVKSMMSLMDELEGENNGLRMKLYYAQKEIEQLRVLQEENNNLKNGLRELSEELDKVMEMKSKEYMNWLLKKTND